MKLKSIFTVTLLLLAIVAVHPLSASADTFNLGAAGDYAVLFEGNGGNTLQITNVTVNGNVGVGLTGKATDSGPSTVNGRIDFSAANTGQFSNNNVSDVITGGVNYNVSGVTSGLGTVNSLSQVLFGDAGTGIAINGNTTVNASAGTLYTVNGQLVRVFDVTSFTNNGGQTLTINGSASDLVAFNLDGLGNVQFHGGIVFTGGLTADSVVFNVGGGNYTALTGAAALDINNNGGKDGTAQGIFLDPNGAISIVNAVVNQGRVFGGDTHDFQDVSGTSITAPRTNVPEPSGLMLLSSALLCLGWLTRKSHLAMRRDR